MIDTQSRDTKEATMADPKFRTTLQRAWHEPRCSFCDSHATHHIEFYDPAHDRNDTMHVCHTHLMRPGQTLDADGDEIIVRTIRELI